LAGSRLDTEPLQLATQTSQSEVSQLYTLRHRTRPIWDNLRHQIYLGGDKFIAEHEKVLEEKASLDDIPMLQRRKTAKPIHFNQTKYKDEKLAIYQTYRSGGYTLKGLVMTMENTTRPSVGL
jgi:hypothetical protein